jgi:NADH-quinone oxidoreductase subunit L
MTIPLVLLAVLSMLLGLIGTPAWPWFSAFLNGQQARFDLQGFAESGVLAIMLSSTILLLIGLGIGWWFYVRRPVESPTAPDPLERLTPQVFNLLRHGWFVDNLYAATFVRFLTWCSLASSWLDRWVFGGAVWLVSYLVQGVSSLNRSVDVLVVNRGFDQGCRGVSSGGRLFSRLQDGRTQSYLRIIGIAFAVLALFLIWGRRG